MRKNKILPLLLVAAMTTTALTACSSTSGSNVENSKKPLVWFNRQPSNSSTGELDMDALKFNDKTYYVGFDANQGAELQGQMVLDYIKANAATIDRNGDGVIGYILAIGDIGHNDSIARTRGVRSALGTGVDKAGAVDPSPIGTNADGSSSIVKDATIEIDGKTYTVRELASQEMKNSAGATWDAATAGNAIGTWSASFGDQIDVVVSNNDGMGMSMFNAWAKDNKVPTFGYDANSDAVAAIAEGYGGTISQHADVQAYLTLRVLRNALDGVDVNTGIGIADEAGNKLDEGVDYRYSEAERSYYALNIAVTSAELLVASHLFNVICNKFTRKIHINESRINCFCLRKSLAVCKLLHNFSRYNCGCLLIFLCCRHTSVALILAQIRSIRHNNLCVLLVIATCRKCSLKLIV